MERISDGNDLTKLLVLAHFAVAVSRSILDEGWKVRTTPVAKVGRDIRLPEDEASERQIRSPSSRNDWLPGTGRGARLVWRERGEDLYWAIDPLDGSYNYYKGIPLYAVSVALCRGRTPVLGATAIRSESDFLRRAWARMFLDMTRSSRRPRSTTYWRRASQCERMSRRRCRRLASSTARFKKIRMIGTAALSLAWVAAGRFDAYEEDGICAWDVAAGLALAAAAGCAVEVAGDGDGPLRVMAIRR